MNFWFLQNRLFECGKKLVTVTLIALFLFLDIGTLIIVGPTHLNTVEAAEVTIDAQASGSQTEHTQAGHNVVFVDDQTGYKFYVEADGRCVYKKTTDGGANWGSEVDVHDDTSCASPAVWYDQWTPGDSGQYIHISMLNSAGVSENITYNRLDTSDDSLLLSTTAVDVSSSTNDTLTLGAGGNKQTITKGTDGVLYMAVADGSGSIVVECSGTCDQYTSWSETGTTPMDNTNDWPLLVPLSGGNIMLIVRDISANVIESQIWNGSVWSGSWTTIDGSAVENTTYDVSMSAVAHPNRTDEVYLVYVADHGTFGSDDDIRTAKYSGGSWSNTSDVLTDDSKGLQQVSIAIDENTDEIYVAYSARTTPTTANTANVYWATSTLAMSSWSVEQGPVNTGGDTNYGISMNYFSDERMYVTWYDDASRDVFGETLADISPITVVSATSSQRTDVRASTTAYIGGTFVVTENIESRNVTSIKLTEQGTIDAATDISTTSLYYDLDTSEPYNCESETYSGSENQFGSSDLNGFSGANGIVTFTDVVAISPTQTLCLYPVVTILKDTADGATIDLEISNPATDVLVSGGVSTIPTSAIALDGTTTVADDVLTQTHYHWRNDDGSESAATSATGGSEDTPISALQAENPRRLRIGLSNEGSTTTFPTTFRLEYGEAAPTCADVSTWTDVDATDDAWNMSLSANLTEGANTTDVDVPDGGVSDENTFFLTPNAGVRESSSETGSLVIDNDEFTALEFSIVASTTAVEGTTYCFRVTDQGAPIETYDQIPQVTISADVRVRATSTQVATTDIPTDNLYIGGAFSITENVGSRNVTSITITENGTVNGQTGVNDVRLYYDLDTSSPYNCLSESYNGDEIQFGATSTAFSAANGSSTFTGTQAITTSQSMCVYVVLDVAPAATNGETIDVVINSPASDVVVDGGGSVAPSTLLDITSSTTLNGAVVTQTHYHWRNDNGSETGASSATGGSEDTPLEDFDLSSNIRLRLGISNEGATTSIPKRYGLEYGIKLEDCEDVTVWVDVDDTTDAWDMFDSSNLTNGETTTDVSVANGGVSDDNDDFLGSNGAVRDTESFSATTTLLNTEYVDLEYSITSTAETLYETSYCFRVTQNGTPLQAHTVYPEVTTAPKRDFRIQHGQFNLTGTSTTLVAGVDYTAPAASTSAFIRIVNPHHTGAGRSDAGGNQQAEEYSAYIEDPENIETSVTFARDLNAVNDTVVSWEIVEFVGEVGTDNEMIVRDQGLVSYGTTDIHATGSVVSTVSEDGDVVVFITGQFHDGATRAEGYAHQSTSEWNADTNEPVFQRGATGGNSGFVSYAVVEFTGINWKTQRVEHVYVEAGVPETEEISPVNSRNRTFLHTQKRLGDNGTIDDFGHSVVLSSIGEVTFELKPTATTTPEQVGVAWVIENTQTSQGAMVVQRNSSSLSGGGDAQTNSIGILTPVLAQNNTSLFAISSHNQTGTNMPRPLAGFTLISTTTYEIYRSESAGTLSYDIEIVEWPVANISIRQNYYRFYADNNTLDPDDPWPIGDDGVGENTSITAFDEPLGEGDNIRIRMTALIGNANLPAGLLSLKLQYGERLTTCSAVETWEDVGQFSSSTIWRAFDAPGVSDGTSLSTDPPTGGDLNLASVSDVAGSYVEENPSVANPYQVDEDQDVEYDWHIEHNGANGSTFYCFRMVNSDGTPLDGYFNYPELRTAGFTPVGLNWRWYSDEEVETPVVPLAAENVSPSDVANGEAVALRLTIDELKSVDGNNTKFKLQFSEFPDFSSVTDVVSTTSCQADSLWCYADGGGDNNGLISSSTLSDADSCILGVGDGCGTHNESADQVSGDTHPAAAAREYSFIIQQAGARANAVYYFRAYDVTNNAPLIASSSYPSLAAEGAQLTFSVSGLPAATVTEGITTDVATTPNSVSFGSVPLDTEFESAQRISIDTNATEGYQVLLYSTQPLLNSYGSPIPDVTSTNVSPAGWSSGCLGSATGCFGYHSGDDTLSGGSTRFSPVDSYAAFSTAPQEVLYSSIPSNESHDVVYKLQIAESQPAGTYETQVVYIAIPTH